MSEEFEGQQSVAVAPAASEPITPEPDAAVSSGSSPGEPSGDAPVSPVAAVPEQLRDVYKTPDELAAAHVQMFQRLQQLEGAFQQINSNPVAAAAMRHALTGEQQTAQQMTPQQELQIAKAKYHRAVQSGNTEEANEIEAYMDSVREKIFDQRIDQRLQATYEAANRHAVIAQRIISDPRMQPWHDVAPEIGVIAANPSDAQGVLNAIDSIINKTKASAQKALSSRRDQYIEGVGGVQGRSVVDMSFDEFDKKSKGSWNEMFGF